ncbi:MAG: Uma2 family endonuclease [Gemmataceae bacterium]
MATQKPRPLLRIEYEEAAEAYLKSLPLEHFMEATAQGKQREITLASLALVHARRPDVQIFNELLVQYPRRGPRQIGQVVPDNMVVIWPEPIQANGSYDLPLQPVGPFWVLEYVSKHNKRKDYEDNMPKYERDLKVPYYLLFYPDNRELTLFHLRSRKYRSVLPNEQGRRAIEELNLEVALLDDWVRFWYKGELLPLPADLQRELDETRRQLRRMKRRAQEQTRRADEQTRRADEQTRRAEEQTRRADEQTRRAEAEQQARQAAQEEVQRLRAEMERMRGRN